MSDVTLEPQDFMEALGLLSADDEELASIWKKTRAEGEARARELMGDKWVDDWFHLNKGEA